MTMTALETIIKKYPFMYAVNEKIYYIGSGVFEECKTIIAIEYFEKYINTISSIGRERIKNKLLGAEEVENLVYYFRKVKNYSDLDSKKDEPIQSNNTTLAFIDNLSDSAKEQLQNQLEDYIYIFKNYYRDKYSG